MTDDWRLTNQDSYLHGARFVHKQYSSQSASSDHDHCEFCWLKFGTDPEAAILGFAAVGTGPEGQDDYHWVCEGCFADFREQFEWRVVEPS